MNEIAFIGDVHGCLDQLREIVARSRVRAGQLVFLGDYVNRGPDSRGVIDYLVDLAQDSKIMTSFVEGNHDRAMLDALENGRLDVFLRMGGAATVRSYISNAPHANLQKQFRDAVPSHHLSFLNSLVEQTLVDGVLARHDCAFGGAGGNIVGRRFEVCGHSPQRGNRPTISYEHAYIDTGCGTLPGGCLTSFFWPSREWIQTTEWDSP